MNPVEFATAWIEWEKSCGFMDGLVRSRGFRPLSVDRFTWQFLSTGGLPKSAKPFLSFGLCERLRPVPAEFGEAGNCSGLRALGHDGAGNPIALEAKSGRVLWLDHERRYIPKFVNSSVAKLAATLLAVQTSKTEADSLRGIADVDADAMKDDSFWPGEIHAFYSPKVRR